ncbi:hypothetical protein N7G274_007402 [Stereocaulon virgatum]|uniref:Uncharacterized protein n=1 Tax=Stereocaulon virgatum TaxID=373712 RepID=A0ABR4A3B1_9LECA
MPTLRSAKRDNRRPTSSGNVQHTHRVTKRKSKNANSKNTLDNQGNASAKAMDDGPAAAGGCRPSTAVTPIFHDYRYTKADPICAVYPYLQPLVAKALEDNNVDWFYIAMRGPNRRLTQPTIMVVTTQMDQDWTHARAVIEHLHLGIDRCSLRSLSARYSIDAASGQGLKLKMSVRETDQSELDNLDSDDGCCETDSAYESDLEDDDV